MKKEIVILFYIVFLFSILPLLIFSSTLEKAEESAQKIVGIGDKTTDFVDSIQNRDSVNETNFSFKEIALRNSFLFKLDEGLTKISPIFDFFMGIPYSFSPMFFSIFALWIFFLVNIFLIVVSTEYLSKIFSSLLSLFSIVVASYLGFFEGIFQILSYFLSLTNSIQVKALFFVLVVCSSFVLQLFSLSLVNFIKNWRKKSIEKDIEIEKKAEKVRLVTRNKTRREFIKKFSKK
jgi:hypothetical protein